jgi:hypothetical protein
MMDDAALLQMLLDLARRLGFEIRTSPLTPRDQELTVRSGACILRGRRLILLDRAVPAGEKCAALLEALRGEDLGGIFVPPVVRQLLDHEE